MLTSIDKNTKVEPSVVVHVTTVHPVFDGRIFHKQCVSLAKHGYDVKLVACHPQSERVDGVEIVPIRRFSNKLARRFFAPWLALIACMKIKATTVHIHDPELVPAALVMKLLGKKVIYDIHEYYSEILVLSVKNATVKKLMRKLIHVCIETWPSRLVDRVVFPTYRLRDEINRSKNSVVLINHLTSNIIENYADMRDFEKRYDFVFVGTITSKRLIKTIEILKSVIQRRPTANAIFVGIPEVSKQWIRENTSAEFMEQHLTLTPRVQLNQVIEYVGSARVGFNYHPMEEKRFQVAIPMKVYEYMATGIPVITSRFPELDGQFTHGENILFVDSSSTEDYATEIVNLLEDEPRQQRIGAAGRDKIFGELNWTTCEEPKLIQMYQSLLSA